MFYRTNVKLEAIDQTAVKEVQMKSVANEPKQESMSTDQNQVKRNAKTLRDQFGHYPIWMNQRQVKRLKSKIKKVKRK